MGGTKRILIVDDEPQAVGLLRAILEGENFDVEQACDGAELRGALAHQSFDLITLDLGMPGFSGVELARELSQSTDTPFIVVSGRSAEFDRVLALEIGADDYIVKPFSTRELAARVRAVLRRAEGGRRSKSVAAASEIRFHCFALNTQNRKLRRPEGAVTVLTVAECRLLEMLVENSGRACTRDEITTRIKGHAWSPLDRSLDTLVARLRRKIEVHPDQPALLMSVRGVGYMMTASA
jgi:two-component system OmpR family response regulator